MDNVPKETHAGLSGSGQRRKGQWSSPAPNSKAKTYGEAGNRNESSDKKKSDSVPIQFFFSKNPCIKITGLNLDAHVATNADFDTWRQRESPVESQRKVVRKDQLHY